MITASGGAQGGGEVDITPYVSWTMGSATATVSSLGLVSCAQLGQTTLTASYSTFSQTIPVTCSPSSWTSPSYFMEQSDEFVGPFPSWTNVKTAFGVAGDGITDDTAGIQAAFDSLNTPGQNPVLWFPAGTYVITAPVNVNHKTNFSILGEDPRNTSIKWGGTKAGAMVVLNGSSSFKISRISLDGNGVAGIAEIVTDVDNTAYNTFNELSDQHIKGTTIGVALTVAAETTIERVFFDHLTGYGLTTGNFNTLNIFINDSLFVGCATGVSNIYANGAGNFVISNSFFANSKVADMSIGNTGYFTARHVTSVNSAVFFSAGAIGANPAQITIQNDTIIDPTGIPLQLGNQGPLMLIDNVIRMQNTSLPAVMAFEDSSVSKSVFSFGNTYTTSVAPVSGANLPFQGVVKAYDDSVVDPSQIPDVRIPTNVYVPENFNRVVYEVPAGGTDSDIQEQIALAAIGGGENAVVHMAAGMYHLNNSVVVPRGTRLQLVGDDSYETALLWDGIASGPAIELDADTVTLRALGVRVGKGKPGDGIKVPLTDQPGTQAIVDQAQLQGGNAYSINFDGLEHATAELFSTYTLGTKTGMTVSAGPFRGAKIGALGVTNFYTGSLQSVGNATSFNVSAGGRLMIQDNWHDNGSTSPQNFVLSGSGMVTEQVGAVFMNSDKPFEIDNFDGKVSLIGLMFTGNIVAHPGSSQTQLLVMGMNGINSQTYIPQASSNLVVGNILNEYYTNAGHQLPSQATVDLQWLRGMLSQTRSEYPVQRLPMVNGSSRKRLMRVQAEGFTTALHFLPSAVPSNLYYTLASGGTLLTTGKGGAGSCSAVPQVLAANLNAWRLVEAGDGDYVLADLTGTNALGLIAGGATVAMSAVDSQYDQRWIVQDTGDGRKTFVNRANGGVLSWTSGSCPQLIADPTQESAKWVLIAN